MDHKLKLQDFHGDPSKWRSWWKLFDLGFHSNSAYSPIYKMITLQSYLKGPAAECISSFEISDDEYPKALERLHFTYGAKDKVRHVPFTKLMRLEPLRDERKIDKLQSLVYQVESILKTYVRDKFPTAWVNSFLMLHDDNDDPFDLTNFKIQSNV